MNNNKSDAEQPLNIGRGGNSNILKGSARTEIPLECLVSATATWNCLHQVLLSGNIFDLQKSAMLQRKHATRRDILGIWDETLMSQSVNWKRTQLSEVSDIFFFFQMYVFINIFLSASDQHFQRDTERNFPPEGYIEIIPLQVRFPDKMQDTCNIWDMFIPKNYSLSIWNSNLTRCPIFLFAKFGNPTLRGAT